MYPKYENKIYKCNFYKYTCTNGEEENENFYFAVQMTVHRDKFL